MHPFQSSDAWLDDLAERTGAGCAYSVTYRGQVLHSRCAGLQRREDGSPVTERTLFRIFSLTKLFTCVTAWALLRQGLLREDEPVADILPDFAACRVLEGAGQVAACRPMTIRQLLTMTSGIPYNGSDAPLAGQLLNHELQSLEAACGPQGYSSLQLAGCVARNPLAFQPGDGWLYGYSHDVLGAAMEKRAGMSLGRLMQACIFTPLGLEDTAFHPVEPSRLAELYVRGAQGKLMVEQASGGLQESGGGGLYSSLRDMAAFADRLACGGDFWRECATRFQRNQLTPGQLEAFPFPGFGYAYGARTLMDAAGENCGASNMEFGWYGVSGSWVAVDRRREAAVVFLQHLKPGMERVTFPELRRLVWAEWQELPEGCAAVPAL